jgi:hypothetical protein
MSKEWTPWILFAVTVIVNISFYALMVHALYERVLA